MVINVQENFHNVKTKILKSEESVGREGTVSLVVVTKNFDKDTVRCVLGQGHRVFGENRVQEAQNKWHALKSEYQAVELHMIGPLQTNKVKDAVALFDVIQTVDREKLAKSLANEMKKQGKSLDVYVQVNTGKEEQKTGIAPEQTREFVATCQSLGLNVVGLMCIPPIEGEPAVHFGFLRTLAGECGVRNLSMGMSSDYEIAVSMGATHVRVGSAIFGARSL